MINKLISIREKTDKIAEVTYKYKKYSKDESNREDYNIVDSNIDSYVEIKLDDSIVSPLPLEIENHIESVIPNKHVNKYNMKYFNKVEEVFNYSNTFLDVNSEVNILNKILASNLNDQNDSFVLNSLNNVSSVYTKNFIDERLVVDSVTTNIENSPVKVDNFFRNIKLNEINKFANVIFKSDEKTKNYEDNLSTESVFKTSFNNFYSRFISSANEEDNIIFNAGFYIEKYIKINDELNFMLGKYTTESLNDRSINYGSTYVYVIRRVYIYESIDKDDARVKNYAFVCGTPFYSGDIYCVNKILPSIPDSLSFYKKNNGMTITWDIPQDSIGNVKGIQILKRSSVNDPFEVIGQLESHEYYDYNVQSESVPETLIKRIPGFYFNEFTDVNFNMSKNQIYAIRSIASTGEKSNYSEQVLVYYDYLNDKLVTEVVCQRGCPVFYPNLYLSSNGNYFDSKNKIVDNGIIKNVSKIKVYLTPEYEKLNNGNDVLDTEDYKFELYNMSRNKKIDYNFKITNL